ncbi:hypothetical protein GCM10018987_01010 [Streptomyces cremeus]
MSANTDSDSAISGGSVRDVLADTNNLSKAMEMASGPEPAGGPEPTTTGWGWCTGGPGENLGPSAMPRAASAFPPRLSPLRSSRDPTECYASIFAVRVGGTGEGTESREACGARAMCGTAAGRGAQLPAMNSRPGRGPTVVSPNPGGPATRRGYGRAGHGVGNR